MFPLSRRTIRQYSSALAVVLLLSAGAAAAAERTYSFHIPKEDTAQALNDFAKQAGVHILFPYDLAAAHVTPAISGNYTRSDCLALLLKDSGLEIAEQTDVAITLRAATATDQVSESPSDAPTEVIVTGTHIRGGNPTSPVHLITSADIGRSGYSQVGDLIRSLPENFSGGQNPGVINGAAANLSNNNVTNASTVNLRGLGTDANLVLVNGHRLSADGYFQGADISGIPLSAIQRIEIVPDGASALYGSDAVAGVVNFIMRHDYSGVEMTGRLSGATEGGAGGRNVSLQAGNSGDNGYVFGSFELDRQDPVLAGDRKFTASAPPAETLIPGQDRNSVFLAAGKRLSDRIEIGADALLSERASDVKLVYDPYVYLNHYYTPAYNIAAFADIKLFGDWSLHGVGVASGSRNDSLTTIPLIAGYSSLYVYRNQTRYGEAILNGTLVSLPSGPVKMALGGGYRTESFSQAAEGAGNTFSTDRHISYAFAEVLAPLVAPAPDRPLLHELELNVSGRTEHYSDFGSTANPKVGIRYVPARDLTLRASWGTSFKAPTFFQLYSATSVFLLPESYVGGTGAGTALFVRGSNASLKPERSSSWTVGADYSPAGTGLRLNATAFAIDYKDRVVLTVPNMGAALSDPIYDLFVQRSPSVGDQDAVIADADSFYDYVGGYDPAQVVAIVNDRYANASRQTVRGVDIAYRQGFQFRTFRLMPFANATWLNLHQRTLPTVAMAKLTGTLFNPPTFKMRVGVNWEAGAWSINGMVNHIASSIDTGVVPNADIEPWTTVDANVAYDGSRMSGALHGVRISLAVTNLFDQAPPLTVSPVGSDEPHFDSTNASILGRFVTLSFTKAW